MMVTNPTQTQLIDSIAAKLRIDGFLDWSEFTNNLQATIDALLADQKMLDWLEKTIGPDRVDSDFYYNLEDNLWTVWTRGKYYQAKTSRDAIAVAMKDAEQ